MRMTMKLLPRVLCSNLYYSLLVFWCLLSLFFVPVDSQREAHAVILSKNGTCNMRLVPFTL